MLPQRQPPFTSLLGRPDRGGAVGGRPQQCRGPHRCSRAASRRPRDLPDAGRRQLRPGRSPDSSGSSACGGEPRLRSALLADSDGGAQNRCDLRSVPWAYLGSENPYLALQIHVDSMRCSDPLFRSHLSPRMIPARVEPTSDSFPISRGHSCTSTRPGVACVRALTVFHCRWQIAPAYTAMRVIHE